MKTRILRCLLAMAFAATAASAQQMNYQGRLTNNAGAPRPGPQATLTFSMWTLPTGGTKVWGDFALDADLIDGRFSVKLGDATGADSTGRLLSNSFATNPGPRYLEIKVGTDAPLPRQQVLPAPTALHAVIAGTVTNGAIGTPQLADLAVTGDKIADNTITVAKLTGAGANFWDGNGTNVWRTGGNVGIGTTTPRSKLDINGNVFAGGASNGSHFEITGNQIRQYTGTTPAAMHLNLPGGNVTLAGGPTGNVGIGTLNPNAKLHANVTESEAISALRVQVDGNSKLTVGSNGGTSIGGFNDTPPVNGLYVAGNVGIGTTTPAVKLDVVGSTSITMFDNGYNANAFSQNGIDWTALGTIDPNGLGIELYSMAGAGNFARNHTANAPVGIRADGYIATAKGFVVYSDRRIKRDMQASATAKDLATIQQLQVTDYRMVDPADGGMAWRKGFIAQEVEKVMPLAVTRGTEYVPDIFSVATAVAYDPTAKTLALTLSKDHDLKIGDRVRLHIDGKREDLNVSAVPSAREFVVEQCENTPEKVLVYGKQVNDFRNVDYDHIYTVSVGAIQELARKVETHEVECTELREANAALSARVAALEAKDEARDTKLTAIEALLNRDAAKTVPISLNR